MPDVIYTGGPYFDEFEVGQVFDDAPAVTLTDGQAALHQAILGDRLRLPLDTRLAEQVVGRPGMAHPGLVIDLAIGQSTLATHHVKANLFYRGLRLLSHPHIGDTLHTRTSVVALRENSARPGRAPTGLVVLHIDTRDQLGRPVLSFHRCAMVPLTPNADPQRHRRSDDIDAIGAASNDPPPIPDWDLSTFRADIPGPHFSPELAGNVYRSSADVVSSAPELARLTLNIAAVHHDERIGGTRLVYGGHTIGLALAQATRALPNMVTVLAWDSCEHTGPVHEGDTLSSELTVLSSHQRPRGGLVRLRSQVTAHGPDSDRGVLDWHFWALLA